SSSLSNGEPGKSGYRAEVGAFANDRWNKSAKANRVEQMPRIRGASAPGQDVTGRHWTSLEWRVRKEKVRTLWSTRSLAGPNHDAHDIHSWNELSQSEGDSLSCTGALGPGRPHHLRRALRENPANRNSAGRTR